MASTTMEDLLTDLRNNMPPVGWRLELVYSPVTDTWQGTIDRPPTGPTTSTAPNRSIEGAFANLINVVRNRQVLDAERTPKEK